LDKFKRLYVLSELRNLTVEEDRDLRLAEHNLEKIWALEEIKARQWSRERHLGRR
jgi:hypothetical protein